MKKIINRIKKHKIISIIFAMIFVLIIVAASTDKSTNKVNSSSSSSTASSSNKKPKYIATLYNIANNDNTPMTLPAAGWDANDGWDTNAQANIDDASTATSTIDPAVIQINSHEIDADVNVQNTGNASGSPTCTVKAEANYPNAPNSLQLSDDYNGFTIITPTSLNGGPINPGQYGNATAKITVTQQGAKYINKISVSC